MMYASCRSCLVDSRLDRRRFWGIYWGYTGGVHFLKKASITVFFNMVVRSLASQQHEWVVTQERFKRSYEEVGKDVRDSGTTKNERVAEFLHEQGWRLSLLL